MNILADESIDVQIVEDLRRNGFVVSSITESMTGIPDTSVVKEANRNEAILLTADKDFGELVYRQKLVAHGVLLIRLSGLSPQTKASIVTKAMQDHGDSFCDSFSVLSPAILRIRKPLPS